MDDTETRLATLELLVVELIAEATPEAIVSIVRRIHGRLGLSVAGDDRVVGLSALKLIDDAADRLERRN